MTDAKDVRETLRERARDARVVLMDAHPTMSYEDAAVVALLNVATEQIDTLTRERDEARKERDHYMIVGLQRLDRIYAVEAQLAAARKLMAEAAEDIEYMVNAEYHGPNDVHPAMRAKYTRDMEIVTRIDAALTQEDTP